MQSDNYGILPAVDRMYGKARKMEKKNIKVETISVGNTNLGGTKDYVGTIEERWDQHSVSKSPEISLPSV